MKKTMSSFEPPICLCFWCNQNAAHEKNKDLMNGYYNCPNHEYKIQFLYTTRMHPIFNETFNVNTTVNLYLNPKLVISFDVENNETSLWSLKDFWRKDNILPNDLLLRDLDAINDKIQNLLIFL